MHKIISVILIFLLLFSVSGCSREKNAGFGEFQDRIKKDYKLCIDENNISFENDNGKSKIYCNTESYFTVFYLGGGNNICALALSLPKERESELRRFIDVFSKCVSVFTMKPLTEICSTLDNCEISADKIKFTDSNSLFAVGKFKYTVITNEMSVTLFCERI